MSTSGPPADAKKAQTAAMAELEAALKKKKAIESTLVCLIIVSCVAVSDDWLYDFCLGDAGKQYI